MGIEFKKHLEVKYETDVFIAGGGPAGIAAAVTAARNGCRVFAIEKEQCFGGAATSAGVPAFMRFSDGVNFVAGGIGREIFDKLYEKGTDYRTIEFPIDAEKLKAIYDDMMISSGAEFLFETKLVDVMMNDGKIDYVIVQGREELFAVKASVYIDATGDGMLAVKAGAPYEKGDDEGNMMPATLCSVWGDIDWSTAIVELGKDPDNRHLAQAFRDNVFTVKDPGLPGMWRYDSHYGGGNIGHVFGIDGTDEASLTQGITEARRRMKEYRYYYNHYLEGYENARVLSTAATLGIRETRRIVCEYMLKKDDYLKMADFDDEIGRYCYPVDIHSHSIDAEDATGGLYEKGYEKGKSYAIPYRSLLPKNTQNLLVAGRCIGAQREMMGSTRVMPGCFITGMAAGMAAAQCIEDNCLPREANVNKLKSKLRKAGAFLKGE